MSEVGLILAKYWLLLLILAIFSIFALIGYITENRKGSNRKLGIGSMKLDGSIEDNLEEIKNNLANSNKSLNSMVTNSNNNGFNMASNNVSAAQPNQVLDLNPNNNMQNNNNMMNQQNEQLFNQNNQPNKL